MTPEQKARLLEHFASILHCRGDDEWLQALSANIGLRPGEAANALSAEVTRLLRRAARARGGEASTRIDCEP